MLCKVDGYVHVYVASEGALDKRHLEIFLVSDSA